MGRRVGSWGVLALAVAAVFGCTKKNPALECSSGQCADPHFPYCDLDGVIDGEPNTCIAVSCAPGEFAACDGDNALTCDTSGTGYGTQHCLNGCSADAAGCNPCTQNTTACGSDGALDSCDANGHDTATPCAAGCLDSPQPHCAYLQPRYLPADICDATVPDALDVGSDRAIDTAMQTNCTGGSLAQSGGADLCVARYSSMSISAGATLHVVSMLSSSGVGNPQNRPIAFVVDGNLTIGGTLDVAATGGTSGPGGGYAMSGDNNLNGGTTGLGGAGFATGGGNGGTYQSDGGAQNAGPQLPNPLTGAVFLGGPKNDGGGGGGVMLVSCRGRVSVSGTISAGGGGGTSGYFFGCNPGLGGGAGGNVVVQAMDGAITGALYANGGGGGAGCVTNTQMVPEQNGEDASLSDTVPAKGGVAATGGGFGGKGGIGTSAPGDGRHGGQVNVAYPGAGGGSVGWLQTLTPATITPTLTPSHASPPLQPNASVSVR